ncbi:MAG TPA: PAS domain S-box protein [Gemmatimonadales bacterium]|nr:PAS domain S-box protein [Gemmatimonadales bacterium]
MVIGLGALAGWRWDVAWLTGLVPGQATMNPAAALAFVLLGVALLLSPARAGPGDWAAQACAALAAVIGLARLSGYALRFDPGIDDLLFAERLTTTALPSRMAPHTALGFVLMGAAVLLQHRTTRRARLPVQLLALASSAGALVSVTGHAYGTRLLSGAMALNTALAFLVAAAGVLWSRPDRGVAALFASPTPGGVLVRRLVPATIVLTLLLGWLRLVGQRAGLYDTAGGTALYAATMVAVFAALAWWSARSLDRADAERRAAEQALRDSEHRLFQILEAMPVAVFVVDASGRPYYANQASRDILGKGIVPNATAERLPEVYQAFVAGTPNPYPPERQPIVRAMRGERAYVADIEIHRPDRRVPLEVWAAPVYDKAGPVAFAVAAFSDITERQRAQQALRESEERHRLLFERNPLPAWVFDLETLRFLAVNDAAVQAYGYTRDEFLSLTIADIRPPEDVAALREKVARITAGHPGGGTWRHRKKDGSLIEVEITSHVLTFAGRPAELVLARDITARRRAEEALRASEERFRTLAATATDAIVSADQRGNVTYFNPGAERIFGYTAEEVNGKPLTLLMPERFRDAHRAGLARYLATGEARVVGTTVELAGRRKDGAEFPLELSLASWRGGTEIAFTGIMRDITERKRAEETLRRYAAQLEVANAELDAFAYSVSHDLRAPLRSIDGFSQALLEDCDDQLDAAGRDHLERVRAATQRMGVLIDDLLRLSRVTRSELRREPVDLSALAEEVAADLRRSAPARAVELTVASGVAAEGDPRLLRVLLENLLGNAWKYTAKQPRAAIEFGVTDHGGERAFFVRDNGAGFDMKYAGKLFGAFQRLHSSTEFEGSGVGLATVQRIVRRHGGRVWAEGAPARGATFFFTL